MTDDAFLAALGLDALLPPALAPWRPLVEEGLAYFLDRLPPPTLAAIATEQFALGADTPARRRLVILFAQCPTLHKLGQVLARHRTLDPALRRELQALESMPPSRPVDEVVARLEDEFGGAPPVKLGDAALAEGSVAVVLPFTWASGGTLRHGVFKVLKPGIEARLGEELAILADVAGFLETRGGELGLPALDYRGTLASVEEFLTREVRLDVEQANLAAAAEFHADEPGILIPRLLPWCTPRVTAMERVFGAKVTDAPLAPDKRRELAHALLALLLARPFWTRSERAVFHADLHGGNLFLTEDGRLAVLDWSLTTTLSKDEREALVAIALAAMALDARRIRRALSALAADTVNATVLVEAVDDALDRLVVRPRLPGFAWLLSLLDAVSLRTAARFPGRLTLFRKTWMSLAGVVEDLAGDVSPDLPLLEVGVERFVAELPRRFAAEPRSRDFSTHLSNRELFRAGASTWFTGMRYWNRRWALAAGRRRPPSVA